MIDEIDGALRAYLNKAMPEVPGVPHDEINTDLEPRDEYFLND